MEGLGQKPKDIISQLVEIGLQPPKDSQITYLFRSIRSKKQTTNKQTSLNEFKEWCERHTNIPDDEDKVFVGKYEFQKTFARVCHVNIDFEILVEDNFFEAITNGFEKVFNMKLRVNCWAHVIRNFDVHLRSVDDLYRFKIRVDVCEIQKIFDPTLFPKAIELFEDKWNKVNNSGVKNLLTYFNYEWGKNNTGWYEGYARGLPSTTNSLESTHAHIKKKMKGKRLGLLHFLDVCQQTIVREWSMWRSPTLHLVDEITQDSTPTITDADMVSAYKWNSFNQTIRHLNSKYYYVMNTKKNDITKEECKAFEKAESSCTCWFGLKDYRCDHQIATCARLKKCSFDLVAMDLPIESNRKRGASKKNASCLQRQKNETNASNEPAKGIESDNEDDESEIAPQPSKRTRFDETKKYCRVCNSEMRLKRYFYCPNKCKQN
ncbi:hypothetical protein BpHYR1_053709 [Brachionus plicatilis]|uniref:SWIM-type domain-containing protein n=1 Tax=Brachionus plicatilis TaxID=10195 RepID=A0A3M7TAM9_BRAPC|nr:hypothetical protein BpHYR1_053709 [Brachionus plicatilis]